MNISTNASSPLYNLSPVYPSWPRRITLRKVKNTQPRSEIRSLAPKLFRIRFLKYFIRTNLILKHKKLHRLRYHCCAVYSSEICTQEIRVHANYPGSGWHTVAYRLGKRLCRDPRSVSVQRRHDRCVYIISHSKYICFCNFVLLSFIWEKIQGDEVEVEKLLIVIFINRMRKNMSLAKRRFSEFNKKKCRFSEFSLYFNFYSCTIFYVQQDSVWYR